MRVSILVGLVFASLSSWALGPIPNGKYKGSQICSNKQGQQIPPEEMEISFTDTAMSWGDTVKEFEIEGNGFFRLLHFQLSDAKEKTLAGKGRGFFSKFGMHFVAKLEVGGVKVAGQDTFFHTNGTLYLISSASGFKCDGEFKKVREAR